MRSCTLCTPISRLFSIENGLKCSGGMRAGPPALDFSRSGRRSGRSIQTADNQIRGQLLNLLAAAHQSRETRLFQMTQGVPGLVWGLLIIFACALIGCMLVFAAEASSSKAVLVGVFTSSLTLALLTVRLLDFPFESALQLPSRDFNETLEKVDHLIATVQPRSSKMSE